MLATTKSYLMVVNTTYRDPKTGKELCGFTSRMGPNAPAPRLLRLKPQDNALTVRLPSSGCPCCCCWRYLHDPCKSAG